MTELPAVPLTDAAARLGLSPEAVRMRVRRGSLTGVKRGRHWFVVLPPAAPATEQEPVVSEHATGRDQPDLVAQLQAAVTFLQAELERRSVELSEMRRLLGNAQQQLAGLLAAPVETVASRAETGETAPAVPALVQTSDSMPDTVKQAAKAVGLGKKQRRKLLDRLAPLWRR